MYLHCTPNIVSMFLLCSLLPEVMTSDSHKFRMALMQFVSQLAMVPVPPPGSLGIVRSCSGRSSIVFFVKYFLWYDHDSKVQSVYLVLLFNL